MRRTFLVATLLASGVAAAADSLPVTEVVLETVVREQVLDGVLEAVNRSTVSAQTSGRVVELPFDVDDYVEKGAVIVRLRDTEHTARLERAEAALREAQSQAATAQAEFQRISTVYAQGLVSRSALDQARSAADSAQARVGAAQASLTEAREQLEHTVVRAPYSGIVMQRHVELGETASPGQPLMTGLSLEQLRAVVDVPQQLIAALRTHEAAGIVLPDGSRLAADAVRIFPFADPDTHTFRVRADLPPGAHGLYPGMLVKVAFASGSETRLSVPTAAVVRRGEITAVYVHDADKRLRLRQIRAGTPVGDRVPVLAGLEAGEKVVENAAAAATSMAVAP